MNATLAASAAPSAMSTLPASSTKPLWAAVGVLSICVLAMGATLVHVSKRSEPLAQASIPLSAAMASNAQSAVTTSAPTSPAGMITEEKMIEKPIVPGIQSTQNAPKTVAKQAAPVAVKTQRTAATPPTSPVVVAQAPDAATRAPVTAPVIVAQAPVKPICANCGTVEAVTPITKKAPGSGVGAVAGGVLGGVVGNQIGKGSGRTVATVLGAIGGGVAGNAIEKNMKKTTAYTVLVRMEDGSSRTIEQSSAPAIGSKVTLDGNAIKPA
jgi:outer membrane lipoprotein SlyB